MTVFYSGSHADRMSLVENAQAVLEAVALQPVQLVATEISSFKDKNGDWRHDVLLLPGGDWKDIMAEMRATVAPPGAVTRPPHVTFSCHATREEAEAAAAAVTLPIDAMVTGVTID